MIDDEVAERVLSKLDGWVLEDIEDQGDPDPYSDSNKIVTLAEVDEAWQSQKSKAKLHIRNNPSVLQTALIKDFWEAVICWTASALWKKYNHKVETPGEEGVSNDNRGKDLYFDGKAILDNLRTSGLQGLS